MMPHVVLICTSDLKLFLIYAINVCYVNKAVSLPMKHVVS